MKEKRGGGDSSYSSGSKSTRPLSALDVIRFLFSAAVTVCSNLKQLFLFFFLLTKSQFYISHCLGVSLGVPV